MSEKTNDAKNDGTPLPKKRTVFTLNKKDLSTKGGAELHRLLLTIVNDGVVTREECSELSDWLKKNFSLDIPAVRFLTDEIDALSGKLIPRNEEMFYILSCILRVLPKSDRDQVQIKSPDPVWKNDPATHAQIRYVKALGGELDENATKGEASAIIDSLIAEGRDPLVPTTDRQRMLLRFWDKEDLATEGKNAVSEWIDEWNEGDSSREIAWLLWKKEHEDINEQNDYENVTSGIGFIYIDRVESMRAEYLTSSDNSELGVDDNDEPQVASTGGQGGCSSCIFTVGIFLAVIVLISSCS